MRKTKVTTIILKTDRTVIVRSPGGLSPADTSFLRDAPDADCDKKGAIEPRKEKRTNE